MMTKASKYIPGIVFAGLALGSQVTIAASVGGYTFDDNAYVDVLLNSLGDYTTVGGAPGDSVADVLTDTDAGSGATEFSSTAGAYLQLGFTDNLLINGIGDDLVLFELGLEDSFELSLSLGGTTRTYTTLYTNESAGGYFLNAVTIDLSDFGVAASATVSDFIVGMYIVGGTIA
jgi:hypothetical protein